MCKIHEKQKVILSLIEENESSVTLEIERFLNEKLILVDCVSCNFLPKPFRPQLYSIYDLYHNYIDNN